MGWQDQQVFYKLNFLALEKKKRPCNSFVIKIETTRKGDLFKILKDIYLKKDCLPNLEFIIKLTGHKIPPQKCI